MLSLFQIWCLFYFVRCCWCCSKCGASKTFCKQKQRRAVVCKVWYYRWKVISITLIHLYTDLLIPKNIPIFTHPWFCSHCVKVTLWDGFGHTFYDDYTQFKEDPIILILSSCKANVWESKYIYLSHAPIFTTHNFVIISYTTLHHNVFQRYWVFPTIQLPDISSTTLIIVLTCCV